MARNNKDGRNEELVNLIKNNFGKESDKFKTGRKLSTGAGLYPHAVSDLIEKGTASPYVITALARAIGTNVVEALVIHGLIHEEDLEEFKSDVDFPTSALERELITAFRQLPPETQRFALDTVQGISNLPQEAEALVDSELRSQQAK
jgi:hypothetical protein